MKNTILGAMALVTLFSFTSAASAEDATKILFIDTGNTGRSVTAEALAKKYIKEHNLYIVTLSRAVDLDPFYPMPEANVQTLLGAKGIDVSTHMGTQVSENDVRHAEVILTLTAKHKAKLLDLYPAIKDKVFTLAEYATGETKDVDDAYGKPMSVYEAMVAQVDGYVGKALNKAPKHTP